MEFGDYLNFKLNISEEANVHQQHLSDEILDNGQEGITKAIRILENILENKKSEIAVTQKWDGSPALVFGILTTEENNYPAGTFFVGTKGVFNVNPKFATNPQEARELYSEGLAEIIIKALEYLPKISPRGIFQGDLMWAEGTKASKKTQTINGKEVLSFKPNTIVYAIDKDADELLYRNIKNSKLGIVVHTQYARLGERKPLVEMTPKFNISIKELGFKNSSDVWVGDALLQKTNERILTDEETILIRRIVEQIKSIKINPELFEQLKQIKPDYLLKAFINDLIKKEKVVIGDVETFIDKFSMWHQQRTEKEKETLKTEKGKLGRERKYWENISALERNKENFLKLLKIYKLIEEAKDLLVESFSKHMNQKGITAWLKEGEGWNQTSGEGYCAVSTIDNSILKLVNRLGFSRINLMAQKEW